MSIVALGTWPWDAGVDINPGMLLSSPLFLHFCIPFLALAWCGLLIILDPLEYGVWRVEILYDIICFDLRKRLVCFRLRSEVPIALFCFDVPCGICVVCVFEVLRGSCLVARLTLVVRG